MIRNRSLLILAATLALSVAAPSFAADTNTQMQLGREARARNDFAAAEAAYAEAARLNPADAQAWHMLGLMQGFQAKYDPAIEALTRAQQLSPKDLDIALSLARISGFAGRFADAAARVGAILEQQPAMAEAWVLKGRIASYQNQLSAARAAYDKAANLGPLDVDLLVAYGDLARAEGKQVEAQGYYTRAAALDPTSADVKERLSGKSETTPAPWMLSVSGGKSWLSRTPAPDWTSFEAIVDRDLGNGTHVFGGTTYARRFKLEDVMLRAGASTKAGRAALSLDLGVTPNDDVLPQFQAFGSASYRLADGTAEFGPTVGVLDAQVRRYPIGTIKTLSPGLDQYLADGRLVVSARWANTWDATDKHLVGWSAAALWQATDRLGLRLGYGNAPEAERGTVADTKTLSGGLIIGLTDSLTWRLDLARESRQGGYRRVEAVGGLAIKF